MTHCKNCNHTITEHFCANCGQPAKLHRIDKHYISHEVLHLLHFEKGFFYTAKELLIRPGKSIREFIEENRNKHMKPVVFLILTSFLYTLIAHFFHIGENHQVVASPMALKSNVFVILHWVETHYGYANILMGILIAVFTRLFFGNYKYNFFEVTILLCFIMGQGMLLLSVDAILAGLISKKIFDPLLYTIFLIYPAFAIGQFYDKTKPVNYLKGLLAYITGSVCFYIIAFIIGIIADILKVASH